MHNKPITSVHFQFLAGLCGNITSVSFGAMIGWLLITAVGLQTRDRSHLAVQPVSDQELTWIISVFYLSAIIGSAYISWMADGYGKKHTLCHLAVGHFLSWGIYMLATNATEMYVAGAIGGFSAGGSLVLMALIIAEIAEDSVRGIISTTTMLAVHVGMLISIVLLCFLSPQAATYGLISLPLLFVFGFVYFPDTPYQLRKEYRNTLSLESLYFYRGCREALDRKSDFMKKEVLKFEQTVVDTELLKSNFVTRAALKAFALAILVILAQQLVCNFFTLAYMNNLDIDFELSHNVLAVGWSSVQLIGCIIAYLTVESIGRKTILVVSLFGTSIGFGILAILLQLHVSDFDLSIFVGFIALASSIGLVPISIVLATDLMPQKIRTMGVTIILTTMWVIGFALFQSNLAHVLGLDIYSYIAAAVTLLVGVVVSFKLPETKGLSNDEVVWALER